MHTSVTEYRTIGATRNIYGKQEALRECKPLLQEYRAIAATRNMYDKLETLRERKPPLLNTGPLLLPETFMIN